MNNAIEISGLRKEYNDKVAVKDVSFQVEEGTLFGLLGVNGAGKTTTIKMLTGLAKPTRGSAKVGGLDVSTQIDEVKKIVNVSTQESAYAGKLTVKENLEFIAGVYGIGKEEATKRINRILEEFGLGEVKNQKAKTLSGGWQRRLSIAMALVTEPKILFLDEPTLGLDVLARRELWKVINGLKGKMTIILTTHYLEEAEHLCDRIAVMAAGELKAIGTATELKEKTKTNSLEEAFVTIVEDGGEL